MKIPDSPIFIERTLKSCLVVDSQTVYATRQDDNSWVIKNIKGKPFEIPAEKLYHPMAEYFAKPTWFRLWKCNRRVRYWEKQSGKLMRTPEIRKIKNIKGLSDKYGIYIIVKNKPTMGFKAKREVRAIKYFFQYRKEDYEKLVEFLSAMVPTEPVPTKVN